MERRFRHLRNIIAFTIALAGVSANATSPCLAGDDWPMRAVKIIVPFAAGSANDVSARLYADGLAKRWSKAVIVENKPGADAIVGGGAFANARPRKMPKPKPPHLPPPQQPPPPPLESANKTPPPWLTLPPT